MRRFSQVAASRIGEMRGIADSLLREEQWRSAVGPLEALRAALAPASSEHARATAELALCLQAQHRPEEAAQLYEQALASSSSSDPVALLNFAELRGAQERWAEAEALARRALLLPLLPSVRGAALANAAAYVAMQTRHAEAASLYKEAASVLGGALGADSEYAVEASAGAVRALRAAGREEEARSFLQSCSVDVLRQSDDSAPAAGAEKVDEALEQLFAESEAKKSLDPPGFVREALASDEEAAEFMRKWTEMGLPSDPKLMQLIVDGFEEGTFQMAEAENTIAIKQ